MISIDYESNDLSQNTNTDLKLYLLQKLVSSIFIYTYR